MNTIKDYLIKFKLSKINSFKIINSKVRDRNDIKVLQCQDSGAIILSSTDHITINDYKNKKQFKYFGDSNRDNAKKLEQNDLKRRLSFLKNKIKNKSWLDFGTGSGNLIEAGKKMAKEVVGLEPNSIMLKEIKKTGLKVVKNTNALEQMKFDIITLFHVYEHLIDPIKTINSLKKYSKKNTIFYIEVPHSNDFLINFLKLKKFKNFTFWSEHLILHSQKTLKCFLEQSGLKILKIHKVQRYNFLNHLYWISNGKPNGDNILHDSLYEKNIINSYNKFIINNNYSDTLLVECCINHDN